MVESKAPAEPMKIILLHLVLPKANTTSVHTLAPIPVFIYVTSLPNSSHS